MLIVISVVRVYFSEGFLGYKADVNRISHSVAAKFPNSVKMKFLALFAILAVVIASSECFRIDSLEETTNVDRIYGSKTARPGQFPYMVSLRTATQEKGDISWRRHKCGGAILGDRWIVTAAHCAANSYENISNLAVAVGSHHISNDGQIYRLDQILIHPAYSLAELINDVGLLRTVNRIQFKISLVQSISLRKQIVGADIAAVTSGWGLVKVRQKSCRFF